MKKSATPGRRTGPRTGDRTAEAHARMAKRWGGRSATIDIHDGEGGMTPQALPDLSQVGDLG